MAADETADTADTGTIDARAPEGEEECVLLVRRLAGGCRIFLASTALLLLVDLLLHPHHVAAVVIPKLVIIAALAIALGVLRHPMPFAMVRVLALATMAVAYLAIAAGSSALGAPARAPLIFAVLVMGTSPLPWGVVAQATSATSAWLVLAVQIALVRGSGGSLDGYADPAFVFAAATVFSIYAAWETRRLLGERRRADAALVARRQAEADALLASDLARVGRELNASLATTAIVERLCRVAAEVLECDRCLVILDRDGDRIAGADRRGHRERPSIALAVTDGGAPGEIAIGAEAAAALRERLGAADVVALCGVEADDAMPEELAGDRGVADALLIALRSGTTAPTGILLALAERSRPLGPGRWLAAQGIGRIASTALANARLLEQLERASRLKSEFVSTMSHELRTPLNVILGNAEILREGVDSPAERDAFLAGILRAGRELLELVDNTLEIGRLEVHRSAVLRESIALCELWRDLQAACGELVPRDGVEIAWGDAPGAEEVVTVDRRKLGVVVRNLVGNAVKFTERGAVTVRGVLRDGVLEVRVADTGIGIAPEHQAAIFEMFRQVDGSDSRAHGGVGLGLYIVRRFVDELGGAVAVESEVGRGSTFTVAVPVRASDFLLREERC
jgi:signal transduction histidine kinase